MEGRDLGGSHDLSRLATTRHILVIVVTVACSRYTRCSLHALVAQHHAVQLLRHVYSIFTRLSLLLVSLALLTITILVVSRGPTVHRLLLLLYRLLVLSSCSSLAGVTSSQACIRVNLLLDCIHNRIGRR